MLKVKLSPKAGTPSLAISFINKERKTQACILHKHEVRQLDVTLDYLKTRFELEETEDKGEVLVIKMKPITRENVKKISKVEKVIPEGN